MSYTDFKIKRKTENGLLKSFLVSLLIGLFTFVIILAVSSLIILNVSIEYEYLYFFVLIAAGVSALICAVSACLFIKDKRLLIGMGVSVVLAITEFVLLICFNNISLSNNVYFMFPIVIFFGFIGCVIGTNIKKK